MYVYRWNSSSNNHGNRCCFMYQTPTIFAYKPNSKPGPHPVFGRESPSCHVVQIRDFLYFTHPGQNIRTPSQGGWSMSILYYMVFHQIMSNPLVLLVFPQIPYMIWTLRHEFFQSHEMIFPPGKSRRNKSGVLRRLVSVGRRHCEFSGVSVGLVGLVGGFGDPKKNPVFWRGWLGTWNHLFFLVCAWILWICGFAGNVKGIVLLGRVGKICWDVTPSRLRLGWDGCRLYRRLNLESPFTGRSCKKIISDTYLQKEMCA